MSASHDEHFFKILPECPHLTHLSMWISSNRLPEPWEDIGWAEPWSYTYLAKKLGPVSRSLEDLDLHCFPFTYERDFGYDDVTPMDFQNNLTKFSKLKRLVIAQSALCDESKEIGRAHV